VTSIQWVRRARAGLVSTVLGASILWAAALASATLLLVAVADLLTALPLGVRRWAVPAVIAAGVLAALLVLWRGRNALSLERVALYVEERVPELQFALATAVRPMTAPSPEGLQELERAVTRVEKGGVLRPPVVRALTLPAATLALGLAALTLVPADTLERLLAPRAGDILLHRRPSAPGQPLGSRLAPVAVHVQPPAYAKRAAYVVNDPASVTALVGSRVEVRGRGASRAPTDSLIATLTQADDAGQAATDLRLREDGDTWGFPLTMPIDPAVLRLRDRSFDRLVVLAPVLDLPPSITLVAPQRDTTLLEGKGRLALDARIQDDIGLARAHFELMHTSGSGEHFETKQTTFGHAALGGRQEARLTASLLLDNLNLRPGDVLHIRALAWDENDVTGPGRGESETRTIRIHDARQLLNVNLPAASAAAIDTSIMSQRMLIMRAETLLVRRPQLDHDEYISQSLRLGVQQGALRGRVESIVYELENVEGVGFVGNTPSSILLREAAEEMREAERELSIVQVPVALVFMRKALALLERIRDHNRYYFRGLLTTTPVEIERIRLTGTDAAKVEARDARERINDQRKVLLDRLDRAITLLERDPTTGRDSLQLLFATSLSHARDVSESLGRAVDALQRGADARGELVATRRRLERRVESENSLSDWSGGP
jgi:hypothetical protein